MKRKLTWVIAVAVTILVAGTAIIMLHPKSGLADPAPDGYYHYDMQPHANGLKPAPGTDVNFPALLTQLGATQLSELSIQIGIPAPDAQGHFSSDLIAAMPISISGPKASIQIIADRYSSDFTVAAADGKQIIVGEVTGLNGNTIGVGAFPGGTADFNVVVNGVFISFGNLVPTDDLKALYGPRFQN